MRPKKLIIEPTTQCNFKCEMCVKQSPGCRIPERNMNPEIFERLNPLFPHIHTFILTGIGEPLMNSNLESWISGAGSAMPENSIRGFQTNGKLLTRQRAVSLVRSGLNKICISVDASDPGLFNSLRKGGSLSDVESALAALAHAGNQAAGPGLSVGVEFVLMKKNMDQLPLVVDWAGSKGVDFILVTHVTAYDPLTEKEQAFMDNSDEGLALWAEFREKAAKKDLDLRQYNKIVWKFYKTDRDLAIYTLVQEMKEAALKMGIYVNLFHLLEEDPDYFDRINTVFQKAGERADRFGIDLTLPEIRPKTRRYCPFVEEDALFVAWDGKVSPCYFLWHRYQTMRIGYTKTVNPVNFGNIREQDPLAIWDSPEYSEFRTKVKLYDYPNCHSWCETRCDYVLDDPFYQDCFINDIPCCDCHWNLGFLNCLN
ncbi:MAG: radical SAM/SPASM family putative metalloenzyme maturase [Desulfobacterales bacterium]|nr:radical SAM/SPASM family putative metalloenzyme maturase [Desulfobacterales bacterium]